MYLGEGLSPGGSEAPARAGGRGIFLLAYLQAQQTDQQCVISSYKTFYIYF